MTIKLILSVTSIIFSLIMLYITQINYKKKLLNKITYLFWLAVWSLIIFVSLRPQIIDDYFENRFEIDIFYVLSILSIISLIILYYISLIKISILEKKINSLMRAESLKEILDRLKDK